jgi:hypothetical protein
LVEDLKFEIVYDDIELETNITMWKLVLIIIEYLFLRYLCCRNFWVRFML